MDFSYSVKVEGLRTQVQDFMDAHVIPRIPDWNREVTAGTFPPTFMEDLKSLARQQGLWNLFLPALRSEEPGTPLTNLEYAPLAEIMGRISWASEVFNCNAPDTGNMELLHMFSSSQQYDQWLLPLLNGEIRSAFAMTEPHTASSDASNIQTRIEKDGDHYVITGRKWWITNAAHPHCRLLIVMGKTDPNAETYRQQSMVLVPIDTPGVTVLRNLTVMNHHHPEGHCEIIFDSVRVPQENLLGEEGSGFALAQARLGPGRIHHCMRSIGAAELALEMMTRRSQERQTFGRFLHEHGTVAEWISRSRIEIEQARLLVLKTAWLIDEQGAKAARKEISMIKALVPLLHTTVIDRAIQAFGAMGVSPDTPLADHWTWGRALRFADGPDEVHHRAVARMEVRDSENYASVLDEYLTPYEAD